MADGKAALAQGVPRREVAAAFGVSRRTVDRWASELAAVAGGGR
ncbi:helix-turn-helix domain-containing protein [Pseudonocardia sp. DR1-2]|nr:helix-turn-helix domain-containing protein [Pseudonocardia sp. DR1-2]MCM3846323.1 helix-turn-helix domain-containing protein [Pseudonocardia sp. DR1-2]